MADVIPNLVSTIIPVFNRPQMLREAVESVIAQTWRPIEIIISDDGSTDGTPDVGRECEEKWPGIVRYLRNPNRGAGPAREAGRQVARGEFIQYLDSDDLLWPRKFEVQVQALRDHPECGAAYGFIRLCPDGQAPIEKPHKWSGKTLPALFPGLLVDRWWNTDAPLWRRTVCDAIGPWTDLRYSQDWEYDARAGALGVRLVHCPEFVTDQRHHAIGRQTGTGRWLLPDDRLRFFRLLYGHALRAGVPRDSPEMTHFSRWVFSQSREAAANGHTAVARGLYDLAVEAGGGATAGMSLFKLLTMTMGWRAAARIAEGSRRLFRSGAGPSSLKQSWME